MMDKFYVEIVRLLLERARCSYMDTVWYPLQ
jgi:hypothetical protein